MAIVCVASVMTPVASTGDVILNAVMAFADDKGASLLLPQPVITIKNAAASNTYNFFIAISLRN